MSAAPIARYLLELDADDDARAAPAWRPNAGRPPTASKAAMVDEAHAKGFESGKAAAEAQMAGKLEEREAHHRKELASAREAWARLESGRLSEQLAKGLEELEARLADTTARILKPFLGAELQRRAIADLVESLTVLRAQDKAAIISVSGAADLLEALRAHLEGKLDNVAYQPSQACDVRVTLGQTVLETRVGAWMARIEEAMKLSDSEEGKSHELVIIRRRASEEEGGHHGGVWKIAYADFMTAMMAFFLVMWLINSTDKKTLTQVATYFNPMRLTDKRPSPKGLDEPDGNEGKDSAAKNSAPKKGQKTKDGDAKGQKKEEPQPGEVRPRGKPFQREMEELEQKVAAESGATSGESPRQAGGRAYRDPFDPVQRSEIIPSEPSSGKVARTPPAATPPAAEAVREAPAQVPPITPTTPQQAAREAGDRADAAQLEAAIKQAVAESLPGSPPNIDVTVTPDGVLISLTDDYEFGMFAIASAEPRPAMIVVMDKVAKILQVRPEPLIIRGHTDRRPYRTATYDNWRLSAARAHMAYVMLARSGVDEKRFERIEGHADRSLRVQHDPEAAQNRRIEILLRKQTP